MEEVKRRMAKKNREITFTGILITALFTLKIHIF